MAKSEKPARGRPKLNNGLKTQLNVRIDAELRDAVEAYRVKWELEELSDAARHILRRTLKAEGLLK